MWAGANNPLYRIKNLDGKQTDKDICNESHYISVISPDKQAIGYGRDMNAFTNHKLSVKKGDILVLFSDGYADQFGGPKGKKYKYKPYKQLLLDIRDKPMIEQKRLITESFISWQGDLEQVDDVCVIGIRI